MTSDLRPYVRTRVLLDYDYFLDGLGDEVILCTNRGILGILRVLVESYGLRKANWVTQHTEAGYYDVDAAQMDIIDQYISEFLGEADMSFCDDLATAINNLAASLGGSGCGCGSAGAGDIDPPPSGEFPGYPGNPGPTGELPPGFADFDEYNTYKCDVAEWIVQQVESDLSWWLNANFVTLALSGFAAGLLTPIPGDEIVLLLGLLVSLALQGVTASGVSVMQSAITNSRGGIICALYIAQDATESKGQVDVAIEDAVNAETAAVYAPILVQILQGMFNLTNINRLYEKWEEKIDLLPTGDCSDCGCLPATVVGTMTDYNAWDTAFFSPASDPPGKNVVSVEFRSGGSPCTVDALTISPTNISPGAVPPGQFEGYQLYDAANVRIYNSINPPPSTDGVRRFVVQSQTAGSVEISWS